MSDPSATPLNEYIENRHGNNITHAAQALGVDRSTLHRVMNSAYVIDGVLYTIKRRFK
jgi:transcriptional regulator of acetoin/glycerol metabolism